MTGGLPSEFAVKKLVTVTSILFAVLWFGCDASIKRSECPGVYVLNSKKIVDVFSLHSSGKCIHYFTGQGWHRQVDTCNWRLDGEGDWPRIVMDTLFNRAYLFSEASDSHFPGGFPIEHTMVFSLRLEGDRGQYYLQRSKRPELAESIFDSLASLLLNK